MSKTENGKAIRDRQRQWAKDSRIDFESDYTVTPELNLPWLTKEIQDEVAKGDGNEFGKEGERGKICALHSSSALGLNFFGYWHSRDCTPLQTALGLSASIKVVRFEEKVKTGVGPRKPNIDVMLHLSDGSLLAIESKFTEWYGTSGRKPLRDAYLAKDKRRWASIGLKGAQLAAETYMEAPGFTRLDVPQLLKHMLGLGHSGQPWTLMLLWYKEPGEAADQMEEEIARFRKLLGPDKAKFSALTYQELWTALRAAIGKHDSEYSKYLSARYFQTALG